MRALEDEPNVHLRESGEGSNEVVLEYSPDVSSEVAAPDPFICYNSQDPKLSEESAAARVERSFRP